MLYLHCIIHLQTAQDALVVIFIHKEFVEHSCQSQTTTKKLNNDKCIVF